MTRLTFNCIGCGRLGSTISRLLVLKGLVQVGALSNQSPSSAKRARDFVQDGRSVLDFSALPVADVTLIATPDDCIESTCEDLAARGYFTSGHIVVHASGLLSCDVLSAARAAGAAVGSIHPLMSFSDPDYCVSHFSGTHCALEGDPAAVDLMRDWLELIGGVCFTVSSEKKARYHAGAVMASNYLVTLADMATTTLQESGLTKMQSKAVVMSLMSNSLGVLKQHATYQAALTGPIQRGDIKTLQAHFEALGVDHQACYRALGQKTMRLTNHSALVKAELLELFK